MANSISCVRLFCGIVLIFCETFSHLFYCIYLIGGISDVLDGFVARYLGKETKLGAQIDTIADTVFMAVVIIKIVQAVYIPVYLFIWIICIAIIKVINIICRFIIFKRFVSEHTAMNKLCGIFLFALPISIGNFPWKSIAVPVILICIMATFAAVQENLYICTGKEIN